MTTVRSVSRGLGIVLAALALVAPRVAWSANNILFGIDAFTVRSTEYFSGSDGFSRISYPDVSNITTGSLGRFGSFVFTDNSDGRAVGMVINPGSDFRTPHSPLSPDPNNPNAAPLYSVDPVTSAYAPMIDRGVFGYSFNPAEYTAELTYKPLPGNQATTLRIAIEQNDGYNAAGVRQGDQWAYVFVDLQKYWDSNPQLRDADGFITVRNNSGPFRDADFDEDNDVDGRDFLTWQRGYGLGVTPNTTVATNAQGDANRNTIVSGADYALWRRDFGGPPNLYLPGALDDDGIGARPNADPPVVAVPDFDGNSNNHIISQGFAYSSPVNAAFVEANDGANFNAFGGQVIKTPHGAVQVLLQSTFPSTDEIDPTPNPVDNWEIKKMVVRKIVPDPVEVVRIDSRTGFMRRNGAMFTLDHGSSEDVPTNPVVIGGVSYYPTNTDQVSRFDGNDFTNLKLKTRNTPGNGVLENLFPPTAFSFDGTQMSVQIKGKLTVPQGAGQANHINVVLKDKDTQNGEDLPGADADHGFGGEQYSFSVSLGSTPAAGQVGVFNTTSLVDVSIPLTAFSRQARILNGAGNPLHFLNPGDGLLTDFNLMSFGLVIDGSATAGAGAVNMEIEYIRVIPTSMALAMASSVVPEPATGVLAALALGGLAARRRR